MLVKGSIYKHKKLFLNILSIPTKSLNRKKEMTSCSVKSNIDENIVSGVRGKRRTGYTGRQSNQSKKKINEEGKETKMLHSPVLWTISMVQMFLCQLDGAVTQLLPSGNNPAYFQEYCLRWKHRTD